jgi:ATP-dependent Clp protease protease subunit
VRRWLNDVLAHHTGQPSSRIEQDTDRDKYMTAQEALEYGIIDHIARKEPPPAVAEPSIAVP